MPIILAPDGKRISFPEGTTPDVMKSAMQKYSAAQTPQQAPVKPDITTQPSQMFGDDTRAQRVLNKTVGDTINALSRTNQQFDTGLKTFGNEAGAWLAGKLGATETQKEFQDIAAPLRQRAAELRPTENTPTLNQFVAGATDPVNVATMFIPPLAVAKTAPLLAKGANIIKNAARFGGAQAAGGVIQDLAPNESRTDNIVNRGVNTALVVGGLGAAPVVAKGIYGGAKAGAKAVGAGARGVATAAKVGTAQLRGSSMVEEVTKLGLPQNLKNATNTKRLLYKVVADEAQAVGQSVEDYVAGALQRQAADEAAGRFLPPATYLGANVARIQDILASGGSSEAIANQATSAVRENAPFVIDKALKGLKSTADSPEQTFLAAQQTAQGIEKAANKIRGERVSKAYRSIMSPNFTEKGFDVTKNLNEVQKYVSLKTGIPLKELKKLPIDQQLKKTVQTGVDKFGVPIREDKVVGSVQSIGKDFLENKVKWNRVEGIENVYKENPIFKAVSDDDGKTFRNVVNLRKSPVFQQLMVKNYGIPEDVTKKLPTDSLVFVDGVKRFFDTQIESAKRANKTGTVAAYQNGKEALLAVTDAKNPAYARVRKIAQEGFTEAEKLANSPVRVLADTAENSIDKAGKNLMGMSQTALDRTITSFKASGKTKELKDLGVAYLQQAFNDADNALLFGKKTLGGNAFSSKRAKLQSVIGQDAINTLDELADWSRRAQGFSNLGKGSQTAGRTMTNDLLNNNEMAQKARDAVQLSQGGIMQKLNYFAGRQIDKVKSYTLDTVLNDPESRKNLAQLLFTNEGKQYFKDLVKKTGSDMPRAAEELQQTLRTGSFRTRAGKLFSLSERRANAANNAARLEAIRQGNNRNNQ